MHHHPHRTAHGFFHRFYRDMVALGTGITIILLGLFIAAPILSPAVRLGEDGEQHIIDHPWVGRLLVLYGCYLLARRWRRRQAARIEAEREARRAAWGWSKPAPAEPTSRHWEA